MSEDSSDSVKRQRMTPAPDVTHVSDSMAQSAQAVSDEEQLENKDTYDSRHPNSPAIFSLL